MSKWSEVRREVTPERRERIDAIKAEMSFRERVQESGMSVYVTPHPWDALPAPTWTDPVEIRLDERIEELEERLEDAERTVEDARWAVDEIRSEIDRLRGPGGK